MTEPDAIAAIVCDPRFLGGGSGRLNGLTVLVTAGPTREAIDPVRYITNRSSGKMGYAMARAARAEGARVILVSGPVALPAPRGVETHYVESAAEMHAATHEHAAEADIFVAAAAVADYRPVNVAGHKIKKTADEIEIRLVRTEDILASVAALDPGPFTVGFAAETRDVEANALGKLEGKRLDMIIANRVGAGEGFDLDENTVCVYWPGSHRAFPTAAKTELARDLVDVIAERYAEVRGSADAGSPVVRLRDKTGHN